MALVKVQVELSEKKDILKVPQGTPVRSILERLEPEWQNNVLVLVNGKIANKEDKLFSSLCNLDSRCRG